jgi:GDP-L-fucose synthase
MPTNLYGPGDNYDPAGSHVLPALIRKAHDVKIGRTGTFEIWGSGEPRREFLHADDCADACVFLMKNYSDEQHVNVGSGMDIRIVDLAKLVCQIVGVEPEFVFDRTKPDGTPRKLMSNQKIAALGWRPSVELARGIRQVYSELLDTGTLASAE